MDREAILAAAREVIQENRTYVLATADEGGAPRMRWMGDLLLEEPFIVTMAAGADSRKMDQVRRNPHAQLMFQTPGYKRVVTLFGECEMKDDPETREKVWQNMPAMKQFVSGPDDPKLGLLRFTTRRVELLMLEEAGMAPLVAEL